VAPYYWRVSNVMKKKKMDQQTAEKYITDTDEKRSELIRTFLDKNTRNMEGLFDVSINRLSFSIKETAELIVSMYDRKVEKRVTERKKIKSIF